MRTSKSKLGHFVAQASILMVLVTGCSGGGDIGRIESALKQSCSNLPSDLRVSGPTTAQEFSQPPRDGIFAAQGGGQYMYWWVLDSSSNRLSMTTAYAGDENVAASWGCPADIVARG
jgi:hypothetical protein